MKQHTMQEWADWMGEYPEKDEDGAVNLHPSLPTKKNGFLYNYWDCELPTINITRYVSDADTHQWDMLIYPEAENENL